MNIVMMTNLYYPHVGGIQRSVGTFSDEYRRRGHDVLIVTPHVAEQPLGDEHVVEVPAFQDFQGSGFSVALPIQGGLRRRFDEFAPDLIHSHHPFLLGVTALRAAALRDLPLVFTYHTMWEHYTHFAPSDSPVMQRFLIGMATEYCNLCDCVIAPTESVRQIVRERGVTVPTEVIPTGIDVAHFAEGDGQRARDRLNLPPDAFVVGHVGRLTPEKNLPFLARAVARFLRDHPQAYFIAAGEGSAADEVSDVFGQAGRQDHLRMPGRVEGQDLVDLYHASDVFAFASQSETQGIVLAEALAAGCPLVALDAPGARDIITDGHNGYLVEPENEAAFAARLAAVAQASGAQRAALQAAAREVAAAHSVTATADKALALYDRLLQERAARPAQQHAPLARTWRLLKAEWELWTGRTEAAAESLSRKLSGETDADPRSSGGSVLP